MANTSYRQNNAYRDEYQYGSTVRRPAYEEQPRRRETYNPAPSRKKQAKQISLPNLVAFAVLVASIVIFAKVMVNYVETQSALTARIGQVAAMRSELNNLRSRNDADYNRIISSIDLNEIEEIAKNELGMTYAQEGQIIFYSTEVNDYMRKVGNQ